MSELQDIILAIDTSLEACSVCVAQGGSAEPLARESMPMARGHAEALLPMIERVMGDWGGGFNALDRIAVTIGPGSFTGIRVGIAAAKAIGLSARIPVVGVTTLSALMAPMLATNGNRLLAAAIDAKHGRIYFQAVAPGGKSIATARLCPVREAARLIGSGPVTIAGSGALALASEAWNIGLDCIISDASLAVDIISIARIGLAANPDEAFPKPLYLSAPDATPSTKGYIARQ